MAARELIQTINVGAGGASSIEFTSIPQNFTDLNIVCSLRSNNADSVDMALLRINGVTSNLANRSLIGDNTASYSASYLTTRLFSSINGGTSTANTFSSHSIYFQKYTDSASKLISAEGVSENNGGYTERGIMANLWSNSAAITSIALYTGGSFVQGSTASLYGINKGSGGASVA